jgi:hypothetical protein
LTATQCCHAYYSLTPALLQPYSSLTTALLQPYFSLTIDLCNLL